MLQLSPEGTLRYQVSLEVKKLVSVSATSMPVTGNRAETVEATQAVATDEVNEDGDESEVSI